MLRTLGLKNFKCFENAEFNFSNLNILAGVNASGKSSLIQALLVLRQSYLQKKMDLLTLNGDLVCLGLGQDVLYEGAKEDCISFILNTSNVSVGSFDFLSSENREVLKLSVESSSENFYDFELFNDNFSYLSAERVGPRTSSEISYMQVENYSQIGPRGEYAVHFLAKYGDKPIQNVCAAHPNSESKQLKFQLEHWISDITPGTRINVDEFINIDRVGLKYQFVGMRKTTNYYRPSNVGFGLTYVLPIIITGLSAKEGAILLIENPEAHLHPSGQVKMGHFLAKVAAGGRQVILETHSDHVLNGIRLAVLNQEIKYSETNIMFFERIEDEDNFKISVTSPKIGPKGNISIWPNGFFDEWEKSLDKLLGI